MNRSGLRDPPSGFPGRTEIRLCGAMLQPRKAFFMPSSRQARFDRLAHPFPVKIIVRRSIFAAFVDFHFNSKGLS